MELVGAHAWRENRAAKDSENGKCGVIKGYTHAALQVI